jgi:hypothetical protein
MNWLHNQGFEPGKMQPIAKEQSDLDREAAINQIVIGQHGKSGKKINLLATYINEERNEP